MLSNVVEVKIIYWSLLLGKPLHLLLTRLFSSLRQVTENVFLSFHISYNLKHKVSCFCPRSCMNPGVVKVYLKSCMNLVFLMSKVMGETWYYYNFHYLNFLQSPITGIWMITKNVCSEKPGWKTNKIRWTENWKTNQTLLFFPEFYLLDITKWIYVHQFSKFLWNKEYRPG